MAQIAVHTKYQFAAVVVVLPSPTTPAHGDRALARARDVLSGLFGEVVETVLAEPVVNGALRPVLVAQARRDLLMASTTLTSLRTLLASLARSSPGQEVVLWLDDQRFRKVHT